MRRLGLVVLAGCRTVLGIPDETEVLGYTVRGNVAGVVGATDDVVISIEAEGGGAAPVRMTTDGAFQFDGIPSGADFAVKATTNCTVMQPVSSVSDGDVEGIQVFCDGLTALAGVTFSAPLDTAPPFTPQNTMYTIGTSSLTRDTYITLARNYNDTMIDSIKFRGITVPQTSSDPPTYGPVQLELGADRFMVEVSSPRFATPRVYQLQTTAASNPAQYGYGKDTLASNDRFGTSIAAAGNLLAVGAPDRGAGAVMLFRRGGRTWTHEATLEVSSSARFGASVAITPLHVVVGAPAESGGGAVYIFTPNGSTWSQSARVTSPNAASDGEFGAAISVSLPSANELYVAIGAPGEASAAGNVYVRAPTGTLTQAVPVSPRAGDRLGSSVDISGSLVAAGAPGDDSGLSSPLVSSGEPTLPDSGAARVFDTSDGAQVAYLKAGSIGAGDRFGAAVALETDPAPTLLVGAPHEDSGIANNQSDNSAPGSGAVYLFVGNPWRAHSMPFLKAPTIGAGDGFGATIVTGDRFLAIGAPYEDSATADVTNNAAIDAGAVYFYSLATGTPDVPAFLKASNPGANDGFGTSVALGDSTLIVGAPYEDSSATTWNGNQGDSAIDTGAVYTFR